MHWDGTRWSVVPGAVPQQRTGMELTGVVALAPHDVWAVGRQWVEPASGSFYGGSQFVIEHWDGTVWRFGTRSGPGLADNVLNAVTSSSAGDLWAVGAYTDWSDWQSQDARQALIEHYTG